MAITDFDSYRRCLGNPGRYQCFLCILLQVNIFALSFQNLNMVFMTVVPPHRCKIPEGANVNDSIPRIFQNGVEQFSQCEIYVDPGNHSMGAQPCPNGWDYFYEGSEWTIIGEWDLVCDRKKLVALATTLYFAGNVVGAPILGYLADTIGRKPVFMASILSHVAVGVIQYFAVNYYMFAVFKFFHGVVIQGMVTAMQMLNMEQFHKAHRTEASFVGSILWTGGQFILTLMAYLCPNWRHLYLFNTLPSLSMIVCIWLLPESLRWLMVKNKVAEAIKVGRFYAKKNNLQVPDDFDKQMNIFAENMQQAEGNKAKSDVRDLFRTRHIRNLTFVMAYLWFAGSLVYYGINFSLLGLGGNKYISFAISAAVEMAGRVPLYFVLKKIGRRIPIIVSFIFAGMFCIASIFVGQYVKSDAVNVTWIAIGLAFLGKSFLSISFACFILMTSEIFPTVVRGVASGLCAFSSRIGGMAAPQILLLGEAAKTGPLTFFGISAIIAGLATITVPETRDISLPDTIAETEELCKKGRQKSKKQVGKEDTELETNSTGQRSLKPRKDVNGVSNQSYTNTEE